MIFHYALKEIKRRKLRSLANILGYVIAVAFLIVAVTLAEGYNTVAATALNGIGTHFAVYIPASKDCPCQFGEVGPFFKDTYTPTFNSTIVQTIRSLQGVADAAPCMMFKLNNVTICGIEVNALATETNAVAHGEIVKGNYLKENDSDAIMIDAVFANVSKLDVGASINAFDRNFTVVGIVDPGLHSKPVGIANMYAALSVVQSIARYYGELYGFAVRDTNVVLVEVVSKGDADYISTVEQSVLGTLESYAGKTGTIVGYQCGVAARKVVSITEEGAWAVSAILLVSVTLFSLKSQFGTVVERTREIGILKAIGWTDSDVTEQVFVESLLQGVAGGMVGVAIGYLTAFLIPILGIVSSQNLALLVSPALVLVGLIVSLTGGVLAGIVPALHAARLQPAEALRRF